MSVILCYDAAVECPELKDPVNGTVTVDDRFYPSEATYECADGFDLSGVATRKCQIKGEWTDDAPVCESTEEEESKGTEVVTSRAVVLGTNSLVSLVTVLCIVSQVGEGSPMLSWVSQSYLSHRVD